jgi:hypothetical protein
MPVLPSSAFVSVETVANLIRVLCNDAIYSAAGEILTDTSTLLFPLMNDSLEWMGGELLNSGVDTFTKETILTPVTAIAVNDPGVQVNISDTGYFDGVLNHAQPQVPTDLLNPVFMWERQTGSTEEWVEMEEAADGLPSMVQNFRLKFWEWRGDSLVMPGALQSEDLRLRYKGAHPVFVAPTDTLLFRGANGPIAYKTVATYLITKNPEAAQLANGEAADRLSIITTRSARQKQRQPISRSSYGRPERGRPFMPPHN